MRKAYSANNLIEAQMILQLLEQAYIPAKLMNTYLQGGLGEIPFTHAYPEVWVVRDEDFDKAQIIIDNYEHVPIDLTHISCPNCSELNPSNFELCWNCGVGLEDQVK